MLSEVSTSKPLSKDPWRSLLFRSSLLLAFLKSMMSNRSGKDSLGNVFLNSSFRCSFSFWLDGALSAGLDECRLSFMKIRLRILGLLVSVSVDGCCCSYVLKS